ncbi:MAG TPA: hypothetical protein VEZ50_09170 [Nodosilinea sp.]|nr:hypothetical protein [Nodosilinea sp.]
MTEQAHKLKDVALNSALPYRQNAAQRLPHLLPFAPTATGCWLDL